MCDVRAKFIFGIGCSVFIRKSVGDSLNASELRSSFAELGGYYSLSNTQRETQRESEWKRGRECLHVLCTLLPVCSSLQIYFSPIFSSTEAGWPFVLAGVDRNKSKFGTCAKSKTWFHIAMKMANDAKWKHRNCSHRPTIVVGFIGSNVCAPREPFSKNLVTEIFGCILIMVVYCKRGKGWS